MKADVVVVKVEPGEVVEAGQVCLDEDVDVDVFEYTHVLLFEETETDFFVLWMQWLVSHSHSDFLSVRLCLCL